MNIRKNRWTRWLIITAALVLLISVGTGVALSYLMNKTEPIENLLEAGRVECLVKETFNGSVKTDVRVKNTGNTSAYIRAAVISTWQTAGVDSEIYAIHPTEGVDYDVIWGDSSWVKADDGFWYYTLPVSPEDETKMLIYEVRPKGEAPDGYSLSVEIAATAIQAEPASVITDEWGVEVNADGTLNVVPMG